ncbi:hypothetical protein B0I35DRAFT_79364 [Stachybotrys elegans]|uniref:Vegetatible incompatibility protein HET-E-1 n=1 Tax=Stachybotrys elegans TaxID=80388 RepID=A0A8K0WPD6_9HYPO|nr:hypothetical protein B0I35DRAFT_79364 [Stachybotrys elegans]
MADFAARRENNIKQNKLLLQGLGLPSAPETTVKGVKRKLKPAPTRQSKRLAKDTTPRYDQSPGEGSQEPQNEPLKPTSSKPAELDVVSIKAQWTAWKPEAEPPSRDTDGTFHFKSHPDFRPNKSPEEIIREGSFGGSYWRPLYSKRLGITIEDDWMELPASWTTGLDKDMFLTNPSYNPEANKYGVACGQSIEEWEAAGWIAHEHDVRGWFQWYCRFWMGRRCADDERQIGRWKKCVGEKGRWRRVLLKKYVVLGIRSVFDEDDGVGDDVSPVVHQTCHHWAYEVRQDALERFWATGT